jgi:hypothetical protein
MIESAANLVVRDADADDIPFLWLMLTYAASMSTSAEPAVEAVMKDAYLRTYVDDWGRRGDLGVVAVKNGTDRVGAGWVRLGGGSTSPFKLGDTEIPELATAILPSDTKSMSVCPLWVMLGHHAPACGDYALDELRRIGTLGS